MSEPGAAISLIPLLESLYRPTLWLCNHRIKPLRTGSNLANKLVHFGP